MRTRSLACYPLLSRYLSPPQLWSRCLTLLLSAVGLSLGCTRAAINPTGPNGRCLAAASIAVVIDVQDSLSGASIADNARGVAQAGAYLDSLWLTAPPPRLIGGNRLGTYDVIVERAAYRQWTRSGVVVSRQGQCGNVIPVQLTALLQHTP